MPRCESFFPNAAQFWDSPGSTTFPPALAEVLSGAFGLTFEEVGLRARAEIVRKADER